MSLNQLLIDRGLISEDQSAEAERHQKVAGGSFVDNLLALRLISREAISSILSEVPAEPENIAETKLDAQFLLNLLLKTLYVTGLETPAQMADYVKLSPLVVDQILQDAKQKRLAEILGTTADDKGYRYNLTDRGRHWALDALSQSQYTGPAPVPIGDYQAQIMKDELSGETVSVATLERALAHLVIPDEIRRRLGPAVNSGKSILIYGPSGNGKTSVAEALADAFQSTVFIPHCIEADGQIITVFDPAVHRVAELQSGNGSGPALDPRWACCRRPVVMTGGELTMEMLDLTYDPVSKYYEAPAHIKATGGVFIIDDFGRQRVPARDLLNRWILPLERRVDFMTLRTGKKLRMPFDQLVIFSTNMEPTEMMDEAAMRRVHYKVKVPAPTSDDYTKIFQRVAAAHNLEVPQELLRYLLEVFYPKTGTSPSGYHPRFIVEHVLAACGFDGQEPALTVEHAREALTNLIVTDIPEL